MANWICPKGHASTESDYCSECGAHMEGESAMAAPGTPPPPGMLAQHCPECGAAREQQDVVFCEICGYNFATGAPGDMSAIPAPVPPTLAPAPVAKAAASVTPDRPLPAQPQPNQPQPDQHASVFDHPTPQQPSAPFTGWLVEVSADATAHQPDSPEAPAGFVPFTVELRAAASLVGRCSAVRAIFPEIDLSHDVAVSHRHALLQLDPAGVLMLRDIGASNGTRLNGLGVEAFKDIPLASGDQITLGHWSRLVLKAIQ